MKNKVLAIIMPFIYTLPIAIFPMIFTYAINASEASFGQAIMSSLLFIVISAVLYSLFYLLVKQPYIAAILSDIVLLFILNYTMVEQMVRSIFFNVRYWHILSVFLYLIIVIGILLHGRLLNSQYPKKLASVLGCTFLLLSVYNLAVASPVIINKIKLNMNEKKNSTVINKNSDVSNAALPNFYYIILDEYSSFDVIKKYYDYDNSDFLGKLKKLGFTVSLNSINDSSNTHVVVGNLLSLDYILNDNTPREECYAVRKNAPLFMQFKGNGYKTYSVDTANIRFPDAFETINADQRYEISNSNRTDDFLKTLYSRTAFKFIYRSDVNFFRNLINNSIDYLKNIPINNEEHNFVFAHILSPHEPFIFDKNGKPIPYEKSDNWSDKSIYLGQYQYISKKLLDVLGTIISSDKNCVVILQSDHSSRHVEGISEVEKRHILNAVYYKGQPYPGIEGVTGLNTLIKVLNDSTGSKLNEKVLK